MNHKPNRGSRTNFCAFLFALFTIVTVLNTQAAAQEVRPLVNGSVSAASGPAPKAPRAVPQSVPASLATLPEADTFVYLSPHLILTEAAPRVMPEKELAELREALSQTKKDMGFDPSNIDFIVLQVRFKKPNANLDFSLPEVMVVASGDFGADALIQFGKMAANEKMHDESYGSKTLQILTIDDLAKEAEKMPLLKSISQVAIVALNGNTIAAGTPGYVKAAIDAAGGKGRISADLLNSVMRDPNALVSMAGSPWTAFGKTFALYGTENNPRTPKCDLRLGDFYGAVTMDPASFKFRGAMYADNPDTAKIYKSLLSLLLQQVAGYSKDKTAQAVISSLMITTTETELLVQSDVSQQTIANLITEQLAPKKQEATTSPAPETKQTTKPTHRRRHRRHKKSRT